MLRELGGTELLRYMKHFGRTEGLRLIYSTNNTHNTNPLWIIIKQNLCVYIYMYIKKINMCK